MNNTDLPKERLSKGWLSRTSTSTARSIFRYDNQWNLLEEKEIRIEGVNHLGAIDDHDGFLWAGLLHGPESGEHDPNSNRSIIAKIRASDLAVVKTWDITNDVTWIDPVCFDGEHLWVGDLSDLGIHRYRIDGDKIERDGVFRYPAEMHFSQGIRVVGSKLYSMHTFGSMDGLFEFDIPDRLSDQPQQPTRVWHIAEPVMHLEGFDFVPGKADQIWHAQGSEVDRYALREMARAAADDEAAAITHGPFIGHITSDTAVVWARCSEPGEYRISAHSQQGHQVTGKAQYAADRDGCLKWQLSELQAATRYHYVIAFAEKTLVQGDDYFFVTADAANATTVRLAFGSCAREDEGSSAVWRQMRTADPHAVVLLGDTPYIDSSDLAVQRQRYADFAAVPDFRRLLCNRSLYATWDDHDFGRNDTDGNLPGKENSRRAFLEYRPNPSFGDGRTGIYTRFRRGGVEVFLLDTRTFAATEPSPFDADRPSLLGRRQWEWLRRALKESTAPFKILACDMIWNGAVRPGKLDHWATYPHERLALFDFIGEKKIGGVLLVGGDVHRTRVLRHKTTKSAGYEIPELITSPIHDGVIATANAPHPALIHDSGKPNTFLLITVPGDSKPARLNARFMDKDCHAFFDVSFGEQDLSKQEGPP